jgi:pyoverdine/dityrosine biosynthesis protein Dit1
MDNSVLYDQVEFKRNACYVSSQFWIETVLPALQLSINETVSKRLIAAVRRAKENSSLYDTKTPEIAGVCTEVFFDTRLFRPNEAHVERRFLHEKIKNLLYNKQPLKIGLPLFSRKPVSPVKNRGYLPDMAEIVSIGRCYEIALILSQVYGNDVEFIIFADGNKYRRACATPLEIIDEYQNGLIFWINMLNASSLVKVVDYETQVHSALGDNQTNTREERYHANLNYLRHTYSNGFNPGNVSKSLYHIARQDDVGTQIGFTFNSIVSSVFYESGNLGQSLLNRQDDAQKLYLEYIKTLSVDLSQVEWKMALKLPNLLVSDFIELSMMMRLEAWEAALKYVAISITDRQLNIWKSLSPKGIKFTVHPKPGEINLVHTSTEYKNMTAQHCVGGIKPSKLGSKITFSYRLERESHGEYPVILANNWSSHRQTQTVFDKFAILQQPICYVSPDIENVNAALINSLLHY